MNRNFALGCLAGAIGGMLGTWMLLFVDIKITIREAPALNINLDLGAFATQRASAIPNPEDGEDEGVVGVIADHRLIEEIVEEFTKHGKFNIVLVPDLGINAAGKEVYVSISPTPISDTSVRSRTMFVGLRLGR